MIRPVPRRAVFEQFRRAPSGRCGPVRVRVVPRAAELEGDVLVAYALSRRTGGAVVRNRARRRLRAVVRELHDRPTGPLLPNAAFLIAADAEVATAPYPEVQRWVEGALERAVGRT